MNRVQIEILYEQKRKNMLVAYLWGAFLGGGGGHYFYASKPEYAFVIIGLFIVGLAFPPVTIIHVLACLFGVVHTYYVVNEVNEKIRREIEVLYGEDGKEKVVES